MKCFKNVLKISIILILLIVSLGSIYAADNSQDQLTDFDNDDYELDEDDFDLDDDSDLDDEDDFDLDDDSDLDDDDDYGIDDLDLDENDSDYIDDDENDSYWDTYYQSYDYLYLKTILYLEKYGNASENWTESENLNYEYQIYLTNPSNYTLNQSMEGYETYLKIFDSITSTFGEYNLTQNQTEYLKFIIIYYLNNYGNVSANYTWNESDEFSNFYPSFYDCFGFDFPSVNLKTANSVNNTINHFFNPFTSIQDNSTDLNSTVSSNDNANVIVPEQETNDWSSILIIILVLFLLVCVII